MTPANKFHLHALLVLLGTIYLTCTEVFDTWSKLFDDYRAMGEKNLRLIDPEDAVSRKGGLQSEIAALKAGIRASSGAYDQSESGLVAILGDAATASGIRIETLRPGKTANASGIPLILRASGSYHRIGVFVSRLESAPIAIKLEGLDISRTARPELLAKMDLEATFMKVVDRK